MRRNVMLTLLILIAVSACQGAPSGRPTARPRPTQMPEATVGALAEMRFDALGITVKTPSTWKPPATDAETIVISPSGNLNIDSTAGTFLYILPDAAKTLSRRFSVSFRSVVTDPMEQLKLVVDAVNRNGPRFGQPQAYTGTQYPAASVTGFERGNQVTLVLIYAGDQRWVMVGTQALEALHPYYNATVFEPALQSLTVR